MKEMLILLFILIAVAVSGCATEEKETSSAGSHEGHTSAHSGGSCH